MKKKLLFIIGSLEGGGAERVLVSILKHFDYEKFEVDLCLIIKSGVFLSEVPQQVKIISLYDSNSLLRKVENRVYRHFRINLFHAYRIKRKVAVLYDSIISFLEGQPLRFHSYIANRASNNISWVHTDLFLNHYTAGKTIFFSEKEETIAYNKMDRLVFVSNDSMIQFKKRFKINSKQQVLYNLVDKEDIINKGAIPINVNKRKFTICSIGSLIEVKAFDRILRVAKKLKEDKCDADFWIIGKGRLEADLLQQRDEMGLAEMVHFLGFQNPPYPFLKMADLFLLVSKSEGFPMVLCEALCLGVPVVATKCTGPSEILGQNQYGVLTEHDDESIYSGIKSMIDNVAKREHYKNAATQRATMFDSNNTMSEIYSVINGK